MSTPPLGVIGLGRMGGAFAVRLAAAGHEVWGFDVAGTEHEGVHPATSVADLASRALVVALSLPSVDACLSVCSELAALEQPRVRTVIELSTVGITGAQECAALLGSSGLSYVDAPVSGGVAGARTGALAMMAAAEHELLETVRPLLQEIAQRLFVVGERPGLGQAMKLLNNYVSATALAATCEAVVFGQRSGLDLVQTIEVLNASSGRTTASTDKLPRSVLPGTYDFGFAAEAMRKDTALYVEGACTTGAPRALAEAVDALWGRFIDACPGTDFTYIHKYLEEGGF